MVANDGENYILGKTVSAKQQDCEVDRKENAEIKWTAVELSNEFPDEIVEVGTPGM